MKIIKLLSWVITIAMLLIILWGLNKGFDLSDEGYYMLGFNKEQVIGNQVLFFWLPVKYVFSFVELNVLNIRIIRLLLTILSSFVLSLGFYRWYKYISGNSNFIIILGIVLIGNFASYTIFPQSLSYNTLIPFYQGLSIGILFYALSENNKFKVSFLFFIIGFLLPFQIITKIISGLLFIVLVLILIFIYKFNNLNKFKFFNLASLIIGLLLGSIIYHFLSKVFLNISMLL